MQRTCEICGEVFQSRRGDARMCSVKCRQARHRADQQDYLYERKNRALAEVKKLVTMLNHPTGAAAMESRYYLIDIKHEIEAALSVK